MGMSASQVRFLSLQSRKNDIGNQLASLSGKKRTLAHDMKNITRHYDNAMNQKILKWSNDSGASYNTLSYDLMMRPNELSTNVPYIISTANNEVVLNNDEILDRNGNPTGVSYIDIAILISTFSGYVDDAPVFNNTNNVTTNVNGEQVGSKGIPDAYYIPKDSSDESEYKNLRYKIFEMLGIVATSTSISDRKIMDYFDAIFLRIAEQGWVQDEQLSNTKQNHSSYLGNKLLNNDYFVTVCYDNGNDTGYEYICKQSSSVNKLFAVNDTDAEDRALSQYETEKTIISTKERRIDTEMQKLETEQEAINTEMESVKKIVDQNVADTFKTFA